MTNRSQSVTLAGQLDKTVAALTEDVDAAAITLARLYAEEIDTAAAWRARADRHVARVRDERGPDDDMYEEAQALRAKLSERTALVALGQRLERLLVELQATPKARGKKAGPAAGPSKLELLRGGGA